MREQSPTPTSFDRIGLATVIRGGIVKVRDHLGAKPIVRIISYRIIRCLLDTAAESRESLHERKIARRDCCLYDAIPTRRCMSGRANGCK